MTTASQAAFGKRNTDFRDPIPSVRPTVHSRNETLALGQPIVLSDLPEKAFTVYSTDTQTIKRSSARGGLAQVDTHQAGLVARVEAALSKRRVGTDRAVEHLSTGKTPETFGRSLGNNKLPVLDKDQ